MANSMISSNSTPSDCNFFTFSSGAMMTLSSWNIFIIPLVASKRVWSERRKASKLLSNRLTMCVW